MEVLNVERTGLGALLPKRTEILRIARLALPTDRGLPNCPSLVIRSKISVSESTLLAEGALALTPLDELHEEAGNFHHAGLLPYHHKAPDPIIAPAF